MDKSQQAVFNVIIGEIEGKIKAFELMLEDLNKDQQQDEQYKKGKTEAIDSGMYLLQDLSTQVKDIKQTLEEQGQGQGQEQGN